MGGAPQAVASRFAAATLVAWLVGCLLGACAAQRETPPTTSSSTASITSEAASATASVAARVTFHHSDFYSLSSPNGYRCAGDAARYYYPLEMETDSGASRELASASPFPTDASDSTRTEKPSWIRGISVDLTDANAEVDSNEAFSCSLGNSSDLPPVSNCATFDYGAVGGIPTSLGGTLLLLGGIAGYNYSALSSYTTQGLAASCGSVVASVVSSAGLNSCSGELHALGIETLPASVAQDPPSALAPGITSATTAISTWAKLSAANGYSGPSGGTGSAIAYDPTLQKILVFGGSASTAAGGATGYEIGETWAFDLKTQAWTLMNSNAYASNSILYMQDTVSGTQVDLLRSVGARAAFGYVSVPGMGLTGMSSDGAVSSANLDLTERVVAVGGLGANGTLKDTHRMNPSFGPDWVDTLQRSGTTQTTSGLLVQWLDSYHTQFLSNGQTGSLFQPDLPAITTALADGVANRVINFGMAPAYLASASAGYAVIAGGFDADNTTTTYSSGVQGGLHLLTRAGDRGYLGSATNYLGVPDDLGSNSVAPISWTTLTEGGDWDEAVPWYGGVSLLQGFNKGKNDLAYFGGSSCRDYLTDSSLTGCSFANVGRYWRLGDNLVTSLDDGAAGFETSFPYANGAPSRAGMAVARGEDGGGNVILVAWGGMSAPAIATDNALYTLFNAGSTTTPSPKWASYTPSGTAPSPMGNAALVFSHVTRKFYLFGGYQTSGSTKTSDETWELSVTGTCSSSCTYAWKKLSGDGGMTCYPDCPPARRSHKMIETSYNNVSPTAEPDCTSKTAPCSFAIFMEGGTSDGINFLADRWIFDPSANGGLGHWSKADGVPPRRLAAMTTASFYVPSTGQTVTRALLFGGEMAFHSPALAATSASGASRYFVAPTLGDTWVYDFTTNTWNRVQLLGKGYVAGYQGSTGTGPGELDARQAYNATSPSPSQISTLTPPPLAGAMMIARTNPAGTLTSTSKVTPLTLPQIYLFGGRRKDGSYLPFNQVYKFCLSSPGEKPSSAGYDDATCDAYDSTTNPLSPGPVKDYVGRWIRKEPPDTSAKTLGVKPANVKSYLGAATYDPAHDLVVTFGGLSSNDAVTEYDKRVASSTLHEYVFPTETSPFGTSVGIHGHWREVPACSGTDTPKARYGHALAFDPLNSQIVVVGGYQADGTPLTQTQTTSTGATYTIPEVWAAKRWDKSSPCYSWRQITTFGNTTDVESAEPPSGGLGFASAAFVPATGYNTGFYAMFDDACAGAGPIANTDASVSRLLAGGAYVDLDRNELGPNENLLLNLTYLPLGPSNQRPDGQRFTSDEAAVLRVHLVKSGLSQDQVEAEPQPRHLRYSVTQEFPQTVQTLAVLAPADGRIRQEQLVIPLRADPAIDRIRIERYSGSAVLIDLSLFRLGNR